MNKIKPQIIDKSIKKELINVFFVTSPIVAIVVKMIILKFKINPNNVLIFSFRNTDLSLLDYEKTYIKPKKIDKYFEKIFFQSPSGNRILKKIKTYNKSFLLYTPIAFREVNYLIKSNLCYGHVYIEEGQHSYFNINSYDHSSVGLFDIFKKNWKNRFSETNELGFYYRDDAHCFIGLSKNIFPKISRKKVFVLDNIEEVKKFYSPILKGVRSIGLTCAERRLEKNNWTQMIKQIIKHLPLNSYIKLHPSFTANKSIYNKFIGEFNEIAKGRYKICPKNTIIELEMMYEKKILIGPVSSLTKYAEMMGSEYKQINLY